MKINSNIKRLLTACSLSKFIPAFAAVAVFLLWLSITRPLLGQAVYGSIIGTVTDSSGAVVPNATITVTDVTKGTSVTTTTNESGQYTAQHLIPDTYTVRAEAPGFKKQTVDNVLVYADTIPRVDIALTLGAASETVTVTSATPLLQTEAADVNTILNARALEDLPNLNRNFTAFELLTPGTSYIGWNVSEAENPQRSQQIEINGQLPFATGYELDGTDNQDPVIGIAVINPNLDAVSEMKVTSQNYDAEFGTAVAGLVTAQTKSGSNSLHGSGFEYYRSSAQQARDPFTQFAPNPITGDIIPNFLHNQFGGSVGGRIIKDKLFFFADYQGERETTGQSFLLTVPTLTAKNTCTATTGNCDLSQYLQGGLGQVYNPATGDPNTGAGRTPYPNNQIPVGQLSTPAVNLLKALPAPNDGTGISSNYIASGSGTFNNDQFDVRVDNQITDKTHIFGRYTFFRSLLSGAPALGDAGGPGFGSNGFAGTDTGRNQSLAVGADHVLSPRWLTDFRFGWFRYHIDENGPGFNQPLGTQLGIGGVNQGDLTLNGGLPQFNIDGLSQGNGLSPYGTTAAQFLETENELQFVNNWSHQVGTHDIKFGADIRYAFQHLVGLDNNNLRSGNFHFAAANTSEPTITTSAGLGLATFLLGDVTTFQRTQTQNTNAAERQKRMFYYVQDHWRITNRITLSYGLRYEWYFPESVNGKGQGGLLDINTGNIRIAGFGPYGTNLNVQKSWTNLAPRLGLSWQATKNTVVRAGLGRVFGVGWSGDFFGEVLTFSFPTQVSQNLNAPTNFSSLFGLATGPPAFTFAPIPADGNYPLPDGVGVPLRPLRVRIPTLDAWNLTVQQEITPTIAVQVAYVGSHGIHNMFDSSNQFDPNEATIAGFGQINPATGLPYTTNDRRPYFDGIAQQLGVTFGAPFGWTQSLRYNINEATSSYNALQARIEKRFSHGLQFLAHYTWSRAMQHESDYFLLDPRVGYGASYYNRPQVFVLTGNWELPFGKGRAFGNDKPRWMNEIIGGWALNGTLTIEKGLPYTPSYASCSADIDTGPCRPSGTGAPYHLGAGSFDPVNHTVTYFQASPTVLANGESFGPYMRPAAGTFGNIFRDSLNGPGLIDTDLSVAKTFAITERVAFQFRTDFFNLFNHPNLGEPNPCVDCQNGTAGKITDIISTQDGSSMRRLQFGFRVTF
jgi:hypothetical protein